MCREGKEVGLEISITLSVIIIVWEKLLTLSIRRSNILLRAELVVGEVPLTSDLAKMHAKGHYCCYFRHKCLQRKCASFCCILIVFSVIFSDVKAEMLPHAKKWSVRKAIRKIQLEMFKDIFYFYLDTNF